MFSIPGNLTACAHHMFQWTANDRAGDAKTVLQARFHVRFARVDLNSLSIQCLNLCRKVIQDSSRPLATLSGREIGQRQIIWLNPGVGS